MYIINPNVSIIRFFYMIHLSNSHCLPLSDIKSFTLYITSLFLLNWSFFDRITIAGYYL